MPTTEPNITIANDNNSIQLDVMAFQAPDIMSKIKSDISFTMRMFIFFLRSDPSPSKKLFAHRLVVEHAVVQLQFGRLIHRGFPIAKPQRPVVCSAHRLPLGQIFPVGISRFGEIGQVADHLL